MLRGNVFIDMGNALLLHQTALLTEERKVQIRIEADAVDDGKRWQESHQRAPIRMNSSVERRSVELIPAKKLFIPGKAGMKK